MRLLRSSGEGLVPGALLTRLFGSFNIVRRIDERDVGKSLRKIAQQTLSDRVIFLGQQADIVA